MTFAQWKMRLRLFTDATNTDLELFIHSHNCLLAHTHKHTLPPSIMTIEVLLSFGRRRQRPGMLILFDSIAIHRRLWKQYRRLMRTQSTIQQFCQWQKFMSCFCLDKRRLESDVCRSPFRSSTAYGLVPSRIPFRSPFCLSFNFVAPFRNGK